MHPLSRYARRLAPVLVSPATTVRPRSSTSPLEAEDDRDDRRRRRRSCGRSRGRAAPRSGRAGSGALEQVLVARRDEDGGLGGGRGGPAGGGGAAADLDQRVGPALVAGARCRSRARCEGCGAASGPRMASSTAEPSGSRRSRYSDPVVVEGLGREVPRFSRHPGAGTPRGGHTSRSARAAAPGSGAGPAPRPGPRTRPAPSHGPRGQAGAAPPISASATAALRTGTRAASTASRAPVPLLRDRPVTCTSAAAPPAAYEWPQSRTHPAGDAASEARTSPGTGPRPAPRPDRPRPAASARPARRTRPQPLRPGLVQAAQQPAQPREDRRPPPPVRLEAGPLHEPNLAATTDNPR